MNSEQYVIRCYDNVKEDGLACFWVSYDFLNKINWFMVSWNRFIEYIFYILSTIFYKMISAYIILHILENIVE